MCPGHVTGRNIRLFVHASVLTFVESSPVPEVGLTPPQSPQWPPYILTDYWRWPKCQYIYAFPCRADHNPQDLTPQGWYNLLK